MLAGLCAAAVSVSARLKKLTSLQSNTVLKGQKHSFRHMACLGEHTSTVVNQCSGALQASNVATYIAHGDVALSVLMTTASTLGAIVMTPLLTKVLAGALVAVDAKVSSGPCLRLWRSQRCMSGLMQCWRGVPHWKAASMSATPAAPRMLHACSCSYETPSHSTRPLPAAEVPLLLRCRAWL